MMKNSVKTFKFNLVEIMLAVVILALGMTSVFVLFPAGLSNHRSAIAENSVADVAELLISQLRANISLYADADDMVVRDRKGNEVTLKTYDDLGDDPGGPDGNIDWDEDEDWTFKETDDDGIYLVRHLSGPSGSRYADFTAIAKVYIEDDLKDEMFIYTTDGDQKLVKSVGSVSGGYKDPDTNDVIIKPVADLKAVALPLVVEISYPGDRKEEEREKSYFRFEIFNEKYELYKTP